LAATAAANPALQGITLEQLQRDGRVPLKIDPDVPFADGRFPTPSGKVELYSQQVSDLQGAAPLPEWTDVPDNGALDGQPVDARLRPDMALNLLSGAAHHFVSSSLANQADLQRCEGTPFVEIHPADAARRGITDGSTVIVENGRGWCELRAVVTDKIRPGVTASPKGRWSKLINGHNINWTTSDALGDMAGQSTFHSNRVWIRPRQ